MTIKYLKTYTAYTSGTFAGRDDGYPYLAKETFETLESLAKAHGNKPNETYYQVGEVDIPNFLLEIEREKKVIQEKKDKETREKKREQLKKLKEELGEK